MAGNFRPRWRRNTQLVMSSFLCFQNETEWRPFVESPLNQVRSFNQIKLTFTSNDHVFFKKRNWANGPWGTQLPLSRDIDFETKITGPSRVWKMEVPSAFQDAGIWNRRRRQTDIALFRCLFLILEKKISFIYHFLIFQGCWCISTFPALFKWIIFKFELLKNSVGLRIDQISTCFIQFDSPWRALQLWFWLWNDLRWRLVASRRKVTWTRVTSFGHFAILGIFGYKY